MNLWEGSFGVKFWEVFERIFDKISSYFVSLMYLCFAKTDFFWLSLANHKVMFIIFLRAIEISPFE
jgi:Na+/melibiose symporter-like transporter